MRNIDWKHVIIVTVMVTGAVTAGFLGLDALSSVLGGAAIGWTAATVSNGKKQS